MPRASLFHIFTLVFMGICTGCAGGKSKARCETFSACGGNLEGTWSVGNSCVEGNLTAMANLNPNLPIACQGMYEQVTATMSGTVAFAAGTATLDTKMTVTYQIEIGPECLTGFAPGLVVDAATCPSLGPSMVDSKLHASSTCVVSGKNCTCAAKDEFVNDETRSYDVSGAKISYSGSADFLEYCVEGSTLRGKQFDSTLVSTVFIDAERLP